MKIEWLKPSQVINQGWYWVADAIYDWVHLEYVDADDTGIYYQDDDYYKIYLDDQDYYLAICDKPSHPIFGD